MQPVSKEEMERELRRIEQNDTRLASGVFGLKEPLSIVRHEFLRFSKSPSNGRARHGGRAKQGIFRGVRVFAFLAGAISLLLFLSFFVERGISLKKEGAVKSMETYAQLRAAVLRLTQLDFEGAHQNFSKAYENTTVLEKSLQELGVLIESKAGASVALLRASRHIAKAGEIISSALGQSSFHTASLLSVIPQFDAQLSVAEVELLQAEHEMRSIEAERVPLEFSESIVTLRKKLPTVFGLIGLLKDYSRIFALALGEESSKTYLVVFQNSSELRPTGGFIGSYALVRTEKGAFAKARVEGIYDADGQLAENVIPPKPFQHITNAWSTHDANWFLDFPTSAEKIVWFFERTGNGKIDGVISLNVEVVEQLLALTGPIVLPAYNMTLDQKNFRDEIQYEVEAAYDKKANRPKQILADFAPVFFEKIAARAQSSRTEILSLLFEALQQKYIMLYFKDKQVQDFFERQGWNGSVKNFQNDDYLAVVHSNIGGYKTDKFMEDKIKYEIAAEKDGTLFSEVTVERTHNGGDTKYWWYNKDNIDYVKIYVPKGSKIVSHSGGKRRTAEKTFDYKALNFAEDPDIAIAEAGLSAFGPIDIFEESGKTVFGTWLITKPKKTEILKIRYELPFRIAFVAGLGTYNLYFQKQPGTSQEAQIIAGGNLKNPFILDKDKIFSYTLKEP